MTVSAKTAINNNQQIYHIRQTRWNLINVEEAEEAYGKSKSHCSLDEEEASFGKSTRAVYVDVKVDGVPNK